MIVEPQRHKGHNGHPLIYCYIEPQRRSDAEFLRDQGSEGSRQKEGLTLNLEL